MSLLIAEWTSAISNSFKRSCQIQEYPWPLLQVIYSV